jgi:hypothetical protein
MPSPYSKIRFSRSSQIESLVWLADAPGHAMPHAPVQKGSAQDMFDRKKRKIPENKSITGRTLTQETDCKG